MISPQELRLGNWVHKVNTGQQATMEQVSMINDAPLDYSPVPISPVTLQAFGFVFHNYFKLWQLNKPVTGTGPEMELDPDFWLLDFSHKRIGVEMKSLHQLQNVYYCLKGKELLPLPQWFEEQVPGKDKVH